MKHKIQMRWKLQLVILMFLALTSCSDDDDSSNPGASYILSTNFQTDADGWEADFADYPKDEEAFYELEHEISALPEPLDGGKKSLKQSGNNHSDDLFMFIKRKITDLEPNREYELFFSLEFASNAPEGSFGVGGSPASSVYIKAGASQEEPVKVIDASESYIMNIDKGNQATEGKDMINLGDFSNGTESNTYKLKTLKNTKPFISKADENGDLWVVFGVDSGFEATTTIYYSNISIIFN